MFGNSTLPGFESLGTFRQTGSIFVGSFDTTNAQVVTVANAEASDVEFPLGVVLKLDMATGKYAPSEIADLPADETGLPGFPLVLLADSTLKVPASGENTACVARAGRIDIDQVSIEGTKWRDLTDVQRISLETALRVWGFLPEIVIQY
jgi:hypothetical protein